MSPTSHVRCVGEEHLLESLHFNLQTCPLLPFVVELVREQLQLASVVALLFLETVFEGAHLQSTQSGGRNISAAFLLVFGKREYFSRRESRLYTKLWIISPRIENEMEARSLFESKVLTGMDVSSSMGCLQQNYFLNSKWPENSMTAAMAGTNSARVKCAPHTLR